MRGLEKFYNGAELDGYNDADAHNRQRKSSIHLQANSQAKWDPVAGFYNFDFRYAGASVPRSFVRDEGRPLGVGLQEQAPNHLKLLWPKATVVSVEEKARHKTVSGVDQRVECKRTTDEVSKT